MIKNLLKWNNKLISQVELLSLRHLSDYVGMERIKEFPEFNLYLVQLMNFNFVVLKVKKEN